MKILSLLVFTIAFSTIAYCQLAPQARSIVIPKHRYVVSSSFDPWIQDALPVEGLTTFYDHIRENLRYPLHAILAGKEGIAYVQFTVTEKGELEDVSIVKGRKLGFGLDEEAIRLIMLSKWTPAINEAGVYARKQKILPI